MGYHRGCKGVMGQQDSYCGAFDHMQSLSTITCNAHTYGSASQVRPYQFDLMFLGFCGSNLSKIEKKM